MDQASAGGAGAPDVDGVAVSLRLVVRPRVPADLLDICTYLDERAPSAADRFLDAARETMNRLTEFPGLGSPKLFRGRLRGVRSWPVRGFEKYLIYSVVVIGVLHRARDVQRILRRGST